MCCRLEQRVSLLDGSTAELLRSRSVQWKSDWENGRRTGADTKLIEAASKLADLYDRESMFEALKP